MRWSGGRGGRPCPSKSIRKAIPCVRRGTKAVSSDGSSPAQRGAWPFASELGMNADKRDLRQSNLAIDSRASGCDLVSLRVDDIAVGGHVRDRATIIQRKTRSPVQFEPRTNSRLAAGLSERRGRRESEPLRLPSQSAKSTHVTARQYARVCTAGSRALGWTAAPTARIGCAAPRRRSCTRKTEVCKQSKLLPRTHEDREHIPLCGMEYRRDLCWN